MHLIAAGASRFGSLSVECSDNDDVVMKNWRIGTIQLITPEGPDSR